MAATRNVYILKPSAEPDADLHRYTRVSAVSSGCRTVQPVVDRTYRTILTLDDLWEALTLHTTPDDVPGCTPPSFDDLAEQLTSGTALYQFVLTVPDRDAERESGPTIIRQRVPGHTLLIGAFSLADLLCISRRQTFHAFDHGLLDTIQSTWRGVPYTYGIVNERMGEWSIRHERWLPAWKVTCSWFTLKELQEASGMLGKRDAAGKLYVFTGYNFIRWAASRRNKEQLARIIQGQVTSEV